MNRDLARAVGPKAARRLVAFAEKARAMSPLRVLEVVLFGSRARGEAKQESDWDVAIVVLDSDGIEARKARKSALDLFADIALPDVATGFHLRPIIIPAAEIMPDRIAWRVSPALARNIRADGLPIA